MAGLFLSLEIDESGINAMVVEESYKKTEIKESCQVLFQDLKKTSQKEDKIKLAIDLIAQSIDIKSCSTAVILISSLSISYKIIELPFKAEKKVRQILPFELESYLPNPEEEYLTDFFIKKEVSGKDDNLIFTASALESDIKHLFLCLEEYQLKPGIITPRGFAIAASYLKQKKDDSNFAFLDITSNEITLVVLEDKEPVMVRSFASGLWNDQELVMAVKQSMLGLSQKSKKSLFDGSIIISNKNFKEAENLCNSFEKQEKGFKSVKKLNPVVFLPLISPNKSMKYLFNFCMGKYASDSFFQKYLWNIVASFIIAVLVFALSVFSVQKDILALESKILKEKAIAAAIFRETFPDKKDRNDPLMYMESFVKEARKKVGKKTSSDLLSKKPDRLTVDVMLELSWKISDSIDIDISRMILNHDRVILSGSTRNFNNVDKIKSNLEKSDLFKKVDISSASSNKRGDRVLFKFIIEM